MPTEAEHPFSADRPVEKFADDKLGRGPFASAVAAAIAGWTQRDSLVLALYGAWGSGKSSIKNMVADLLRQKTAPPLIVEFNPWQWAAQDQLAKAFFDELSAALTGKEANKDDLKYLGARLRVYAAHLRLGGHIASGLRKVVVAILATAAIIGAVAPFHRAIGLTLAALCAVAAGVLAWSEELFEKIAGIAEARENAKEQKLSSLKAGLSKSLAKLKTPLLIIIDDVDRLTADQIRLLFQVVKANADFPNVVYFLLFQRDIVEKCLAQNIPDAGDNYGKEYLEKIVQVGFDVPRLEQARLERFLFEGLDKVLGQEGVAKRFDNARWWTIFTTSLRSYFTSMRDVNRFLGSFAFHVSLFRNRGNFEVNPVDLIAIEVLRLYEPEVYHRLFQIKESLTGSRSGILSRDKKSEEAAKAAVTGAAQSGTIANHGIILKLLQELFPQTRALLGGIQVHEALDAWYRDMRVCHPDVFDRYFYFAVPENDISAAELEDLLGQAGNRDELRARFLKLKERGLLGLVMDRLEAYKEKIDLAHAVPFVTALFDVGDDLPRDRVGMFDMGADMHASRIIYWYLKKAPDSAARARILREAITATTGIYLPVKKISLESDKKERSQRPDLFALSEEDVAGLQADCIRNVRRAAGDGQLKNNHQLLYILFRWKEWASEDEVKNWVKDLIASDDGLLTFLCANLRQTQSVSGDDVVTKTRWDMDLKTIEVFAPITGFEDRLKKIPSSRLNERQQLAVDAFFRALERRAKGKGDDAWHWDDD